MAKPQYRAATSREVEARQGGRLPVGTGLSASLKPRHTPGIHPDGLPSLTRSEFSGHWFRLAPRKGREFRELRVAAGFAVTG
jgi:hypothetical protein